MPEEFRQTAITFYNAARAEVVQRLALREQVVLASLTASGVIGGIAFRAGSQYDLNILLLIPLLVIAFTIAFARHDWIIRHIGEYIKNELRPSLAIKDSSDKDLHDWDGSKVLSRERNAFLVYEKMIFATLLCGPAMLVLWAARPGLCSMSPMYVFGLAFTGAAVFFFLKDLWRVWRGR